MQNLIEKINDIFQKKFKLDPIDGSEFNRFVSIFYGQNKISDFEKYSTDLLCHCAISSLNFIKNPRNKGFAIRIFNPTQGSEGFESNQTLIEIINDDMPFLVDSVVSFLDKHGIVINNIIHPIFSVFRDANGNFLKFDSQKQNDSSKHESLIQLHLEKINDSEINALKESISKILKTVALVVEDWDQMQDMVKKSLNEFETSKNLLADDKYFVEIKEFLNWILAGNFILLGVKEFAIKQDKSGIHSLVEDEAGLGIFRSELPDFRPEVVNSSPKEVGDSVLNPYFIEILKSRYRSRIHRNTNAERIRVQKISADGKVVGEFRIVGLFTSSAYFSSIFSIPLIRGKAAKVIENSGYENGSHNYKDLVSTLESYPRDELFQISEEDLLKNATGIVAIAGRSLVKFFARNDKFGRFVSCLIFTPRDRSNSELREKIKQYLCQVFDGEVADSFVQITDSNLIRFHVIIRTEKGIKNYDESLIESDLHKMTLVWNDLLFEEIKNKFSDERRVILNARYKNAFSISYTNRFDAKSAVVDVEKIEESFAANIPLFNLYKNSPLLADDVSELKIYSPCKELTLSKIMPVLESFGFNVIQEHTYTVNVEEDNKNLTSKKSWIHYFHINLTKNGGELTAEIKKNFEDAIDLIWNGDLVSGPLNRLIISLGFTWKKVYMLCAYGQYLAQIGFRFNPQFFADLLERQAKIGENLISLFETKFNPNINIAVSERAEKAYKIVAEIEHALNDVKDSAEDAIIRKITALINATLRTNFYQSDEAGDFKGYVSFKFNSRKIPDLPLPHPNAEIFVYSARFEAIHLRGGKVARGGLRWSDRQDDFRTEILGLMKAQMTKNAVIVPVGSKGGFVLKRNLSQMNRDELQQEGIACYKLFLSGLLDITDNVVNGQVEHPKKVVMHDEPDPYLVVAADKGTATFSDIANSVSAQYNFWLGDAFASGGSAGYDHKKMGITAKGAWISVMRHFREMGRDIQSQDFTCIGIGDLAGDVFGNGMLLSRHIKLLAAFNHMHIFLDPNPNPETSFLERQRIFNLPRSTWKDYNEALISKGGGVFERSAKAIPISSEVKEVLSIYADELSPNDLIRAILCASVDLLWNGGIGTYVKAADENHQQVGDKANDLLRVNGSDLRCLVVGEGGNLGFTQKGRIEYARKGGRINTDAMDNSAGVDCSDHEVNIKIAITSAIKSGKINLEERNIILENMTGEVSDLVLADNRMQTQAISIAESQKDLLLSEHSQFLDRIEKTGLLNRAIEFLPSRKEIERLINERKGLTRPELSVMLAYSKMEIYGHVLASDLVLDDYFNKDLFDYFPKLMQQKFGDEISSHQLRKEIIATQITNFVVNRIGINFINQISLDSGFSVADVVKSFIAVCEIFGLREVWKEVENLDGKIPFEVQSQMFLSANKLVERSVLWLLKQQIQGNVSQVVAKFQPISHQIFNLLPEILAKASRESFERKIVRYRLEHVERELAKKIAAFDPLASTFDIAEILNCSGVDLKIISEVYYAVGNRFSLKWLRSSTTKISTIGHWQKLATKTVLDDIYSCQMRIAKLVVQQFSNSNKNADQMIDAWISNYANLVEKFDIFIEELKNEMAVDLAMFIVAINRLKPLLK